MKSINIYIHYKTDHRLNNLLDKRILRIICNSCESDIRELRAEETTIGWRRGEEFLIDTKDAIDFVNKFPNMEIFELKSYETIDTSDRQTLQILLDGLKNLKSFYFSDGSEYSEYFPNNDLLLNSQNGILLEKVNPKLETLQIYGPRIRSDVSTHYNCAINLINLNIIRLYDFQLFSNIISIESLTYFKLNSHFKAINIDMKQLFAYISKLVNLKALILRLFHISNQNITSNEIKCLRKCTKLEEIYLFSISMSDDSIKSIARYVPNIKYLELPFAKFTSNSSEIWEPLQKMHYLNEIILVYIKPEYQMDLILDVLKKCRNLEYIELYFYQRLNFRIEWFRNYIAFANTRPKTRIKIYIPEIRQNILRQCNLQIPSNLILKEY